MLIRRLPSCPPPGKKAQRKAKQQQQQQQERGEGRERPARAPEDEEAEAELEQERLKVGGVYCCSSALHSRRWHDVACCLPGGLLIALLPTLHAASHLPCPLCASALLCLLCSACRAEPSPAQLLSPTGKAPADSNMHAVAAAPRSMLQAQAEKDAAIQAALDRAAADDAAHTSKVAAKAERERRQVAAAAISHALPPPAGLVGSPAARQGSKARRQPGGQGSSQRSGQLGSGQPFWLPAQ